MDGVSAAPPLTATAMQARTSSGVMCSLPQGFFSPSQPATASPFTALSSAPLNPDLRAACVRTAPEIMVQLKTVLQKTVVATATMLIIVPLKNLGSLFNTSYIATDPSSGVFMKFITLEIKYCF